MMSDIGRRTSVVEGEEERGGGERRRAAAEEEVIEEYEVEDLRDDGRFRKRRGASTFLAWDLGLKSSHRDKVVHGMKGFSQGLSIHPRNRWYRAWEKFILLWAVYSSFFTPMEFGFFRGLPNHLYLLDIIGQLAFFMDVVLQFFLAYRDPETEHMIFNPNLISLRYLQSYFIFDLLSCLPWDSIYRACGRKEEVRYLLLIRLVRARKVHDFFSKLEKDIRVKYLFSRILKLIAVELYCTHVAACIFYYLATTLPAAEEEYTWIGSLKLGDYSYSNFRDIDLWKRYVTSLYFSIITMATVGYGDIHAVNLREMIFVMVYVLFDMVLGAYLVGNITALVVKGSKTELYRERIKNVLKYMDKNRVGRDIRDDIKVHLQLPYRHTHTESAVLKDLPTSIRTMITETLYKPHIEKVPLFKGCSSEFINQIVNRVHEEFFPPGKVIMEQGSVVDQLYFICDGMLEEVVVHEGGPEEEVSILNPHDSFGDVSIICNIPLPYTVRVRERCLVLCLDHQAFSNILKIYFHDKRKILNNLLEGKENDVCMKDVVTDIKVHIGFQEAQLALRVSNAVYNGDLSQLQSLIRGGADPNKKNFDGRTPLHLAASKGHEDIVVFLIQEGVDVNISDNFGNTPLLEAIKRGHDNIASLLIKERESPTINNDGSLKSVDRADLNSKDFDFRTPLHIATSRGSYVVAKLLVEAGASVLSKDRWGNTPLDEARLSGNKVLIELLEEAKSLQMSESPSRTQEPTDKMARKRCTIYPFQPWEKPKDQNKYGVVLWVPDTIDELVKTAADHLNLDLSSNSCIIITQDAAKILDVDIITEGQKLYLITTEA